MDDLDGIEVMVNRTGYTGETGVELMVPADEGPALWDAVVAARSSRPGLVPRDTLRLEVCYPLHGTTSGADTDAISAGLGWVSALDKDFTGADELRRIKAEGPARKLAAFVMEDSGLAPGHADRGGGEVTSGTHSPMLDQGIGMATCPPSRRPRRARADNRCPWPAAARPRRRETDLQARGGLMAAAESYLDELAYHPEHDGWRGSRKASVGGHFASRRTHSASESTSSRPRWAPRSRKTAPTARSSR